MPETQEMIDFCAAHKIVSDVEMVPIQTVNEAYEWLIKNDVRYRFVIDMASLKQAKIPVVLRSPIVTTGLQHASNTLAAGSQQAGHSGASLNLCILPSNCCICYWQGGADL